MKKYKKRYSRISSTDENLRIANFRLRKFSCDTAGFANTEFSKTSAASVRAESNNTSLYYNKSKRKEKYAVNI